VLETAIQYTRRGWSVVPIPHGSNSPGYRGWRELRLAEADLEQHFNGAPQNIGLLTGEPSGWLIDVRLEHPRAVELASEFLPPTPAVFGRQSKRRSHWLYRATAPMAAKKLQSKSSGVLVEVRSTGSQTLLPPSTHESGEPIEWEDDSAEPTSVDPESLLEAAARLADAVRIEIGEKQAPRPTASPSKTPESTNQAPAAPQVLDPSQRASRCLAAMMRLYLLDRTDGSARLGAAARRVVEHDLDDASGLAVVRQYARQRPFPTEWSDEQILSSFREAENVCRRGAAFEARTDENGLVPLGGHDPATGRLVLSPRRTLPTAEAFVRQFYSHVEGRTLHCHAGVLLEWTGSCYAVADLDGIKKHLQGWLHDALRYATERSTGEMKLIRFDSNPASVKTALETIRGHVHLPATIAPPAWLGRRDKRSAAEFVPCRSMLLHLPTMEQRAPTPALFATNALDFDPDPMAREPAAWLEFLEQLFGADIESLELLQNWFAYCLTADTSQQKMLLIVGPRRSGKGTIARVLNRLIGPANVCGPTTSSLAGSFGLQPLVGKSLAIVSDARFGGDSMSTVVERLLCISGEDAVSVDRKFLPSVTMKLPTRFMFLSNELPRLKDTSGALAGRFLVLRLTESFFGREDTQLTNSLLAELPGILNWAIAGWHRLHARGHFVVPRSVEDAIRDMEDLASPVGAFVRDECIVGPGHRVSVDDLWIAWQRWCQREGRTVVTTRQSFGRDLAAAVSGVTARRSTGMARFYEGLALTNP